MEVTATDVTTRCTLTFPILWKRSNRWLTSI